MQRKTEDLGRTPFAARLIELMDRERVGVRVLARIAGKAPGMIAIYRRGTKTTEPDAEPLQPEVETIRILARALATDWVKYEHDERTVVDAEKEREYFRALMAAAGYLDGLSVLSAELPPDLVAGLDARLGGVRVRLFGHDGTEWTEAKTRELLRVLDLAAEAAERERRGRRKANGK